ncbi:MAG TPA: MopE-related protein [Polyangiales bacterium]|nr:MopE-related protein [Polyangiales bacterium]
MIKRPRCWQLSSVVLLSVLGVAGCGRFGVELLPRPVTDDGDASVIGTDDSGAPIAGSDGGTDACSECGCGVATTDGDGDGTPDCVDECPSDANKARAGQCGCAVSEQDTDLDGVPDCIDHCAGNTVNYTPDDSCGVGYCRANNTASTCMSGVETSCVPSAPLSASDATCNGVDDDCDGQVDEDYVGTVRCGVGVCSADGTSTCVNGVQGVTCDEGDKTGADDDCDNLDDDCDGTADEHYVGEPQSCGDGICAATGRKQCVDGVVVDICVPNNMAAPNDTSCNNIDDDCDRRVDEDYVVTATTCGQGACARSGSRTCVNGRVVDSCVAGMAATSDTSCNNIDDDCNGQLDEDYAVTTSSCGTGYCAATGQRTCASGAVRDSCMARAPRTTTDDAFSPGNGVDDDCDGRVDEDVPACNTTPITFEAGQYTVAVPGNCKSLTVRLWGGAGASGENKGVNGAGGSGGSGGYASSTALVSGTINVFVGTGGAGGCNSAGNNAGSGSLNGGSGGGGDGANGADGTVAGGNGASPNQGGSGGRGYYGGGGGGQGNGGLGDHGNGGGGGAASVLLVNGTRVALAGGGGGGGGADSISVLGTLAADGGAGGAGCSGSGNAPSAQSGGGGGGGVCQGSTVTRGSGATPANGGSIPNGRARGGSGSCQAGGNGYATITFAP